MTKSEPISISPKEAFKILQQHPNAILVDVRSSMEFLFVGHPKGAVHIAWIDEPDWDINPHFTTEIHKLLLGGISGDKEKQAAVILICRSGKRSFEAGKTLLESDFENVYNVDEGFEGELDDKHQRSSIGGWRYHGLPWEQC